MTAKHPMTPERSFDEAVRAISRAQHLIAFTGAGISVESGIPGFRGPEGLWSHYDPQVLDIAYFFGNPLPAWTVIREIFYDNFGTAQPNQAHKLLAFWEEIGVLKALITMNIDDLHYRAGTPDPIEYHGNSRNLVCTQTGKRYAATPEMLKTLPPVSDAGSLLKPDFVFFGEPIPSEAAYRAEAEVSRCDVMLVIGTTGEVFPAAQLPVRAHHNGATIIEINVEPSRYTHEVTDLFLQGPATAIMARLNEKL